MKKMLSIGSVVQLRGGERKVMILNRAPLFNDNGIIGYFDYSACLFPEGQTDQQVYFFNSDDIAEIHFEGYIDENEEKFRSIYDDEISKITYPKLLTK
ncbi:MAG: DUF4176 domain-containing protein [Lachnospiraceae bacterium]|nr:DUF4176 domain-containing protein [Lachnospiraceae bacterium]